jgi:hypothetical protein
MVQLNLLGLLHNLRVNNCASRMSILNDLF